nr:centrosomal protein of 192 kDa isoform X1 [Camelus dromedarius]
MTVFSLAVTVLRSFAWSFYCSKINFFSGFQFLGRRLREMEDVRGIAEESFPSFLTNSLLGNSGILENVTLSSNLGLPVAVSTLARSRHSPDNRFCDVQASYLVEGRFSIPLESSPSSQSEVEPRERLQLVFREDESSVSKTKNRTESQRLSDVVLREPAFQSDAAGADEGPARVAEPFQSRRPFDGASPLQQVRDLPVDSRSRAWMNEEDKIAVPDAGEQFEERSPSDDLSHLSLLENEQLMSLASLEESSDDDIDDEEFYDDHLEAYFEQLAIPGMIYEDLEGQEPPEVCFTLPTSGPSQESAREEVLVKTLGAANAKLNPVYFHDTSARKEDFDLVDPLKPEAGSPHQSKHLTAEAETALPTDGCSDPETREVSAQENVHVAALKPVRDDGVSSADALWPPAGEWRTCEYYESFGKSKDHTDPPQSVVYQNEEGRWVTDLAYYTSFNKEEDVNASLSNELNEDFRSGSEALDLIAQDEEDFNKEHQFLQEENMDARNTSVALGDTSWGASVNYSLLRRSLSTSDLDKDDASYLRLSLGEFFAQRSEALGCLGGGHSVRRPSFGYFIRSPEKREPVALIRESDTPRSNLEKGTALLNQDLSSDVNAQLSEGSVTLQAEELESVSQVDENDTTLTASKGQTEDTFFVDSKPQRHKGSGGDSVLRVSTIAAAIADASASADPSQLAAMIRALSNKTREKTFQEHDTWKGCPTKSGFLPRELERSGGSSTLDMEKYLRKTEVSGCEGGLETLSRAGVSDIWDLSLPRERTPHDIRAVDGGAAGASVWGLEANTAAAFCGGNRGDESQMSLRTVEAMSSVLTSTGERGGVGAHVKTRSADCRSPGTGDGERVALGPVPTSSSYSLVRSPRVASLWLSEERKDSRRGGQEPTQRECGSEMSTGGKHAACGNPYLVSPGRVTSPGHVGVQNPPPEHGGRGSEDDQDSFRPSTSPLSHSSPGEASGTSVSGYALESFAAAAHPQKPACERESSQLTCPQASVTRLTYVSEPERSTCPSMASERGLEGHKSDVTNELSTTIVQCSPVPSEAQAEDVLREDSLFQSRGKRALPYIIQKNVDTGKVTETTSLSSNPEDVKPNLRWSGELASKSEDRSETSAVGLTSDPSESDQSSLARLSSSGPSLPAVPAVPRLPTPCQGSVDRGEGIASEGTSATGSALSCRGPHQVASGDQCGPIPCTVALASAPEMHSMPLPVPTAPAQSPSTAASCAQQCLDALPSAGTAAPPWGGAASTVACGSSGSCPHCAPPGERIPNPICLGRDTGSGFMGTSSLCHPCSSTFSQNLLSTAKPFPVRSVGPRCGVGLWDSGVMSGFGRARLPEALGFPHACCVGIASQTLLSVLNPGDRWLQASVRVLSVSVDGEKVDLSAYPCLVFKNQVIIRPQSTEEIKVLFMPSRPGIFRCIFSVASWPFSADAEAIVQAEALASRVVLTAVAETPVIEIETEKKDVLDFGDLAHGGWRALPLKLVNRTHAAVPVRLVISANATAWRCFTFSREPVHAAAGALPYATVITQLAAPSVVTHMMPASYDGQDPEFLIIWVLFHSPKKQIPSSEILDSAEEFLARVDVELDSPNATPVITSVSLRARAGVARIHAPKDLQTMHLFASVASSAKQCLPLKNAGNIDVYLDIEIPDRGSHFSVDPGNLFLKPGEEQEVTVSFTLKDPEAREERILKIFVQPSGPQYEVMLKGEVVSLGNKPPTPGSCCSNIPSILSNKQFLAWAGVPLGRTQLQKLALRNNSTSAAQHLRLLIRGQDQDCFQLQHTFGSEERLTSSCEIRIRPKEDIYVSVLFAPTRLSCMLAKLEIKQLGIRSQPGIKFTIPLSGYGGTSNLILEDVKKLSDSYMVAVNDLVPGRESRIVFSVRNTGSRAAFVKAVGFKDSQKKVLLDPKVLRIFPDKFVLKERTQEDVTIIYTPSDRESSSNTTTELSTVYFFGGDEISRQQYRRALLHKPGIIEQVLAGYSVLQKIDFAEAFQDELLVTEVYDLPQRPNDIQLFYGNMRKIVLSVIGEFKNSISNRELPPSSKASLESKSEAGSCGKHGGNVSLDVLPVKGPQGPPLPSRAVRPPQDRLASEETWAVQPEHLILVASSCDLAKTGRFQIVNNCVRLLRFELHWPAHCLTVTPPHGFVAPESKLQILVSPNFSFSMKQSVFPWSGFVYVHCDSGQKKIVKVQIREDLTTQELCSRVASSPFGALSSGPEPAAHHLVRPGTKPPSTKVEIRNKTVTFPATEPGETSENHLDLENPGDTDVRWHLSSLAPPYVKGADESGGVFRATYAAFRCSPVSGLLESHGTQTVSVTFLPRDRGDYAQFWDVECHPLKEPHLKHTLRFQLCGQSIPAESEPERARVSAHTLVKVDNLAKARRRAVSEASAPIPGRQLDLTHRGVYAPEDVYQFLPTRVGESRTLKVNLRNNSFITHSLKFLSPREPFYVKHSKYSLRAQHYINMPVQFRPRSVGRFEALLVVQTDEGRSVAIRLVGEAFEKS